MLSQMQLDINASGVLSVIQAEQLGQIMTLSLKQVIIDIININIRYNK